MTILVTGAAGFVGRRLCRTFHDRHRLVAVDNFRFGDDVLGDSELGTLDVRTVDVRDRGRVAELIAETRPDAIVHLAAIHFIPECDAHPDLAVGTNVGGTVNLLLECPPSCRFVLASSAAVYRPSSTPLVEERSPVAPADVYGLTKAHAEDYVRLLARQRGFPAVVVRLFNVMGPGETNPHVLPEIIGQLRSGADTLWLGNTAARRDFVHVADAADGFVAAAVNGSVDPGDAVTVNLGSGVACSIGDVVEELSTIIPRRIRIEQDRARLRTFDNPLLLADNDRMKRLFAWTPGRDLRGTLEDLWRDPEFAPHLARHYQR